MLHNPLSIINKLPPINPARNDLDSLSYSYDNSLDLLLKNGVRRKKQEKSGEFIRPIFFMRLSFYSMY